MFILRFCNFKSRHFKQITYEIHKVAFKIFIEKRKKEKEQVIELIQWNLGAF